MNPFRLWRVVNDIQLLVDDFPKVPVPQVLVRWKRSDIAHTIDIANYPILIDRLDKSYMEKVRYATRSTEQRAGLLAELKFCGRHVASIGHIIVGALVKQHETLARQIVLDALHG